MGCARKFAISQTNRYDGYIIPVATTVDSNKLLCTLCPQLQRANVSSIRPQHVLRNSEQSKAYQPTEFVAYLVFSMDTYNKGFSHISQSVSHYYMCTKLMRKYAHPKNRLELADGLGARWVGGLIRMNLWSKVMTSYANQRWSCAL